MTTLADSRVATVLHETHAAADLGDDAALARVMSVAADRRATSEAGIADVLLAGALSDDDAPVITTELEPSKAAVAVADLERARTALRGTIIGVEDWVTVRANPALTGQQVDQVPARTEVAYFPESIQSDDRFEWMEISADGACGWVTGKFVKDVEGRVVGQVNAIDYTHRALRG